MISNKTICKNILQNLKDQKIIPLNYEINDMMLVRRNENTTRNIIYSASTFLELSAYLNGIAHYHYEINRHKP